MSRAQRITEARAIAWSPRSPETVSVRLAGSHEPAVTT